MNWFEFQVINKNNITVYYFNFKELIDAWKNNPPHDLHFDLNSEQLKHNQAVFNKKLGRGLLLIILSKHLDVEVTEKDVDVDQHGKPFLKNGLLKFNISYCEHHLVIGLSEKQSIGIDLESTSRSSILKENLTILHPVEQREYYNLSSQYRKKEYLLTTWVKKEAILKAIGVGLKQPMNSLITDDHDLRLIPLPKTLIGYYVLL